jgi:hypothetical protein
MLTTVLTPTEGRLLIAGHDPVKEALLVRRAFGIVFQDPSLDGEAAAAENMELHGVLYRVPRAERRARVEALLCSDTSSRTLVISVPFAPKRPRIHKWDQEFESAFLQRRVTSEPSDPGMGWGPALSILPALRASRGIGGLDQ